MLLSPSASPKPCLPITLHLPSGCTIRQDSLAAMLRKLEGDCTDIDIVIPCPWRRRHGRSISCGCRPGQPAVRHAGAAASTNSNTPLRPSRIRASSREQQHPPYYITPYAATWTSKRPQDFRVQQHRPSRVPSIGKKQLHSVTRPIPVRHAGAAASTNSNPFDQVESVQAAESSNTYHTTSLHTPPPGPASGRKIPESSSIDQVGVLEWASAAGFVDQFEFLPAMQEQQR